MSDIFISYKSEDVAFAKKFAEAFQVQGWSVFWDRDIPPGTTFDKYIGEQLQAAKCVVVLWSSRSVDSDWVKEEAQHGARRQILVPILIEDVAVPLGFGRIEAAELFAWNGDTSQEEFSNLTRAIERLLGQSGKTALPLEASISKSPKSTSRHVLNVLKHRKLLGLGVAFVVLVLAGLFVIMPFEDPVRIWKVGSPHDGKVPSTVVPLGLAEALETLGRTASVSSFSAAEFPKKFADAAGKGEPPDIVGGDNYLPFEEVMKDPTVKERMLSVSKVFRGIGDFAFIYKAAPGFDVVREIALKPPDCSRDWDSMSALPDELDQIATEIAEAYLEGSDAILKRFADPNRLEISGRRTQIEIESITDCGYWGNENLAFIPVVGAFESQGSIGQVGILLILRREEKQWRLLTAGRDPIRTGLLQSIPRLTTLFNRSPEPKSTPEPATLLSPEDGQYPHPKAGSQARFGEFVWKPSPSSDVVAEIGEFANRRDTRLFIRWRSEQGAQDRISTGKLYTVRGPWWWRIWSISDAGVVTFSDSRTFQH